jgi:hypothetical protein
VATFPSPEQTLASYVATYGSGGMTSQQLAQMLGVDPKLFALVDARVQPLPSDLAAQIAAFLGRPLGEVVWAAGGVLVASRAAGAPAQVDPASRNPLPQNQIDQKQLFS